MTYYTSLEQMMATTFATLSPPEQLTVAECAKQYVYIRQPGSYVGYWSEKLTPYLVEPQEILESLDYTGMIFVGPARTGKALALDTPIATPSGWSTMGELKQGDFVFGDDGKPCRIVGTSPVMLNHDCFRVRFDDGEEIVADADHLWFVHDIRGAKKGWAARTLTTRDLFARYRIPARSKAGFRSRYAIPVASPIQGDACTLPLDPYALGVWLGDGCRHTGYVSLNSWDMPIIRQKLESKGFSVRVIRDEQNCHLVTIADETGKSIYLHMKDLGLGGKVAGKFIPLQYLRAEEAQRWELLKGLLDTDGHGTFRDRAIEWSTSDELLRDGFCELLSSLGIKFNISVKTPQYRHMGELRKGQPSYRVMFTTYAPEKCFSLPRQIKACSSDRPKKESQVNRRWIRSIEKVESVPVKCIAVDNSSRLYLAGRRMVPTHNTQLSLNWVAHIAKTDPSNMILLHMTQATGRNWSKSELDKMFRDSPEIRKLLRPGRANDNTFDKEFLSGMRVEITWPTANNLSGKTSRRNWAMDYDRMPDNIDGEGNAYDLLAKRAESFKRFGMTAAESSPNPDKEITDPKWTPATPHEAPPIKGIFELYNLSLIHI